MLADEAELRKGQRGGWHVEAKKSKSHSPSFGCLPLGKAGFRFSVWVVSNPSFAGDHWSRSPSVHMDPTRGSLEKKQCKPGTLQIPWTYSPSPEFLDAIHGRGYNPKVAAFSADSLCVLQQLVPKRVSVCGNTQPQKEETPSRLLQFDHIAKLCFQR